MIGKMYETLDDAIMHGVKKTVRAYNWTTGGTKAELANGLLTVAPVLESAGYSMTFFPVNIICILGMLSHSHVFQEINQEMEQHEVRALEQGMLSMHVESYKERCKRNGLLLGAFAGHCAVGSACLPFLSNKNSTLESTYFASIAVGVGMRSLSFYVMRADYLPPRRNCVARGWEKLEQRIAEYRAKPTHAPAPVAVPAAARTSV